MELSLRTTLAAQVEGDSSVVVPGKLLVDLARLLPASEVTIEYRPEDGVAHISSGSYSSKLNVFSAEDFPRLPSVEPAPHTIATRVAARDRRPRCTLGVEGRVAPGPDRDPGAVRGQRGCSWPRPTRTGSRSRRRSSSESGPELEAIIPARALTELSRIAGGTETVELGVNENTVVFGVQDPRAAPRRG